MILRCYFKFCKFLREYIFSSFQAFDCYWWIFIRKGNVLFLHFILNAWYFPHPLYFASFVRDSKYTQERKSCKWTLLFVFCWCLPVHHRVTSSLSLRKCPLSSGATHVVWYYLIYLTYDVWPCCVQVMFRMTFFFQRPFCMQVCVSDGTFVFFSGKHKQLCIIWIMGENGTHGFKQQTGSKHSMHE